MPNPSHYLYPGTLFAHSVGHCVTTVLGSCVAVCLWDGSRRCGGINHFLLPLWNGEGLATPRYGNIAIDALLEKMLALGCHNKTLVAKVFGGAAMWKSNRELPGIGDQNIDLARKVLAGQKIPIVGEDVGGCAGRKILFDTATGAVLLRRLAPPEYASATLGG